MMEIIVIATFTIILSAIFLVVLTENEDFLDWLAANFPRLFGNPDSRLGRILAGRRGKRTFHHKELMRVLLGLDEEKLNELLELYKQHFGPGPARYARRTYRKWKAGEVQPQRKTFERFLVHLPEVMDFDLKCEVLRHLMESYCAQDKYHLTVYTDDWEETLEPLVRKLIDKPYTQILPPQIERQLLWLAGDEMRAAGDILKRSQVEEGRIAVSMLREEFGNIERLLAETENKRRRVTHRLKFPYGTINLEIRRR